MADIKIERFKSPDGVEHQVAVGSAAHAYMVKENFTRIDEDGNEIVKPAETTAVEPDQNAKPAPIDRSEHTVKQLKAEAEELGIEIDPKAKKADIIAAIEAKLAEQDSDGE